MSWDSMTLLVLALVWALVSVLYVLVIGMMPGARAWGAGAVIFLILTFAVWLAERRQPRRAEAGKEG